ncbi:DUF2567 domain-containing protein [Streptomyces sp. NPDC127084]|uniref:DUF2567 domain-containing protein n=1 Tax=Streptomyces sp. NPDC127084 TaxID=3347133 RepID=UPI003666F56E
MTAPLTPPHQPPPPHDATWYAQPVSHGYGEGQGMWSELRAALIILPAVVLSGVGLGLLWLWLAPRVGLVATANAVFVADTEGEQAAGADATFTLLALGFGALTAALVFWLYRRGGVAIVLSLALGGLLASGLAWLLGYWFGPEHDIAAHARAVGEGVRFDAPLELQSPAALLAWPFAAMLVHLALTALFGPRDPEPDAQWPPLT